MLVLIQWSLILSKPKLYFFFNDTATTEIYTLSLHDALPIPWRTLRAPWRERQRLRRASLVALFDRNRPGPEQIAQRDYTSLIGLYDDFEGLEAQRSFPAGTFEEFLSFVAKESKSKP